MVAITGSGACNRQLDIKRITNLQPKGVEMNIDDMYTKCTLTVIAIALCVLAMQSIIVGSKAQNNSVQKVEICNGNADPTTCLSLVPIRKQTSDGQRFLTFALPIFAEQ
jgi:hypothetical protein